MREDQGGNKNGMFLVPETLLADNMHDAAAIATTHLGQATAAVAHRLTAGAAGVVEGRWERETFLLPIPDAEDVVLADRGDASESIEHDDADAPDLLGSIAEGPGDKDGDDPSGDNCSASVDDGVHLRVEVWQGKHCHGQVGGCIFKIRQFFG